MSYLLLQVLKCLEVGWTEVGTAIQYMYLFVFGTLRLRVQGNGGCGCVHQRCLNLSN